MMMLFQNLNQKAKQLKSEAQVLMITYRDKLTPVSAKILIGITVGYLLSSIDLIPDFKPVLGILDDLLVVPEMIALSIKLIPKFILEDAREELKIIHYNTKRTIGYLPPYSLVWLFIIVFLIRRFSYLWN